MELLIFSPDKPDPLPAGHEPYLMVLNLDTKIFVVNATDTYQLPSWVRVAPAGWQQVADPGTQRCPDARPLIYRVAPRASAAAVSESAPAGRMSRQAPQDKK